MSNITAMTSSNIFYQARCAASRHNDQLGSREGAADLMSIDRGRLYRIEKGVINPYPEEVHLMADLYHAPELRNHFCREMCPLGCDVPKVTMADLDRISVRAVSAFRKIGETNGLLLDIAEDGVVTEDEMGSLHRILANLEELEQISQSLKLWVRKNL